MNRLRAWWSRNVVADNPTPEYTRLDRLDGLPWSRNAVAVVDDEWSSLPPVFGPRSFAALPTPPVDEVAAALDALIDAESAVARARDARFAASLAYYDALNAAGVTS